MTHARNRRAAGQLQPGRTCGTREWTARRCSCGAPPASGRCTRAASASGTVREGVRTSGAPSRRLQERGGACVLAAPPTPVRGASTLRTRLPASRAWPKGQQKLRLRAAQQADAEEGDGRRTCSASSGCQQDEQQPAGPSPPHHFYCYNEGTSTGGRRPLMLPNKCRRRRCAQCGSRKPYLGNTNGCNPETRLQPRLDRQSPEQDQDTKVKAARRAGYPQPAQMLIGRTPRIAREGV